MAGRSEADRCYSASHTNFYTLHFKIRPAKIFKNAISALTDTEFNPKNLAMIDVCPTGCLITVRRIYRPTEKPYFHFGNQIIYGVLNLKDSGLADFECIIPLRKTVNLSPLSESLAHVRDDDDVWVRHLSNTPDILYFEFRSATNNKPIELSLLDESLGPPKYLSVSYSCKTVIASKELEAMAERILKLAPEQRPDSVSVYKDAKARLGAGMFEAETMTVEHHFSFVWRYWGMLMKASRSAENCVIRIVTVPDESVNSVMVRFDLGEVGTLTFLAGHILLFQD